MKELLMDSFVNTVSSIAEDLPNFPKFFNPILKPERDIGIFLFTRKNPNEPVTLKVGDIVSLRKSNFKNVPTKIIIHGWTDSSKNIWTGEFRENYLKAGDYNVILVDWFCGASKDYLVSAKVTRQVGLYIYI